MTLAWNITNCFEGVCKTIHCSVCTQARLTEPASVLDFGTSWYAPHTPYGGVQATDVDPGFAVGAVCQTAACRPLSDGKP